MVNSDKASDVASNKASNKASNVSSNIASRLSSRNALKERIKLNEGTIEYQQYKGFFSDGYFHSYKCSEGFTTIGYGHRCADNQLPITPLEADALLDKDIETARVLAAKIHIDEYQMVNDVLTEMIFQLGHSGTKKFKKFLAALQGGDYNEAANQIIDSNWYRQTPNRVKQHAAILRSIK
ncbi:glycoside hydrolase family protein [Shewanella sp.]|uniref:glycoside hydrolase family protein n=1 Tax=Shewanella sp. TaxID=50422 RepID=UPI0040489A26